MCSRRLSTLSRSWDDPSRPRRVCSARREVVSSDSVVRDADMAEEMTDFTRNQILVESGTAMLAQANQMPRNVLALLA